MTDSIIPIPGRYEADDSDGGCVDGTVASKYSEATKASAIQQVQVEGQSPKAVADQLGVNLATLRRWLKDAAPASMPPAPRPALPERVRLVILDADNIHGKLERILRNEGFALQLEPLRGHPLSAAWTESPEWLERAWLFELPPTGAQRLFDLIERSARCLCREIRLLTGDQHFEDRRHGMMLESVYVLAGFHHRPPPVAPPSRSASVV